MRPSTQPLTHCYKRARLRGNMVRLLNFILFLKLLVATSASSAQQLPEYLSDPYLLSAGSAVAGPQTREFHTRNLRTLNIALQDSRYTAERGGAGQVEAHFYKGCETSYLLRFRDCSEPKPLMIFFPGLGSQMNAAMLQLFAEKLANKYGVSTLALPSVAGPDFIKTGSFDGAIGNLRWDMQAIYRFAIAAVEQLKKEGYQFTSYAAMGYSMGALQTMHFAEIDSNQGNVFKLKAKILLNPPVDLLYGMNTIDAAYSRILRVPDLDTRTRIHHAIETRIFNLGLHVSSGHFSSNEEMLSYAFEHTTPGSRRYLVGLTFHQTLVQIVEGAPGEPELEVFRQDPVVNLPRYFRTTWYTFSEYLDKILTPIAQASYAPTMTSSKLNQINSLPAFEHFMKEPSTFLVHNEDDFLLRESDISYLRRLFGSRAVFFPFGGHLGNVATDMYQAAVEASFKYWLAAEDN